jgi:SulP family sulfate permease
MTQPRWRDEWLGGVNGAATMLPFLLSYGFIVFGAAGAATAQIGLTASVLTLVLGSLLMLAFSRSQMPAVSPSASTALILGTLVLELLADPALRADTPDGAARLLACTSATVTGAGVLLLMLGLARAGQLVRYVPQPVLAGFMNGVALLIVWSQVPAFFGVPAHEWARGGVEALAQLRPLTLAVAAATTVLAGVVAWRWPGRPAPMIALIAATIGVLAVQAVAPDAVVPMERIGDIAISLPRPDAMAPWLAPDALAIAQRHGGAMVTTALLLALIGGLESVLGIAAVDPLLDRRTDPDRELRLIGLANIVIGLFGGLFLIYLRLRALATINGGGRGTRSVLTGTVLIALVFTFGLPLVRVVPVPVVAGIVVMLAWTLVDRWSRQLALQWWKAPPRSLRSRSPEGAVGSFGQPGTADGPHSHDLVTSLLVVALVCVVTLRFGFVAGVLAGVLASMLILVRALDRSLVRLRYLASEIPSRRIYPSALEQGLQPARARIDVFELEGALFFGNAQRLAAEVERAADARKELAHVVIDLRRVGTIDASGAVTLAQLGQRLARHGRQLHLAGLVAGNRHDLALRSHGVAPGSGPWQTHPDADRAIEAAERALLDAAGRSLQGFELAPQRCDLLAGLDAAQAAQLLALMPSRALHEGERLFAEGEPGDAIYLLTAGSISIVDTARTQRYLSLSPGMCFGETAVLDGQGRTAAAVADIASTVHRLAAHDLEALQRLHPEIAAQVHLNLARHLSRRLRSAAAAWQRAAS